MKHIWILISLSSFAATAQKNTRIGELKGVDFKAGYSSFNFSGNDAIKIYSEIVTPNLVGEGKVPIKFYDGYSAYGASAFSLGLCSKNKWFKESKILKNSENRFGIGYANYRFSPGAVGCSFMTANDTIRARYQEAATIKYYGYSVHADYLINSIPFSKDFVAYAGLGCEISLQHFKAVDSRGGFFENNEGYLSMRNGKLKLPKNDYSLTSINGRLLLGCKYNLSCDFNLFMELSVGAKYYHKGLAEAHRLIWLGDVALIGIRYKFISAEEKTRSKASVFW